MISVELTDKDAELFKRFRQYQAKWERLFDKDFVGSLTVHSGGTTEDTNRLLWEWNIREK